MRRVVARQRAGCEHGVGDANVVQPRQSPKNFHSGIEIDGIDDDGGIELLEGEIADGALDQVFERLFAEQRRRAHALERHVGMRDGEEILAAQVEGDFAQLGDAHAPRPRGADQRPDARPDDAGRPVTALEQRLKHAHVGDTLHAAAAQHEGERCVSFHSAIRLPGGLSSE